MTLFAVFSALAVVGALTVLAAVARRSALATRDARRREVAARLRPAALDVVDADASEVPELTRREVPVFAELLVRYSRGVRGDADGRIAAYFEASGAVDRAIRSLRSRRERHRVRAAFELGDLGSPRAVPALLDALEDRSPDVRGAAARSLGRLHAVEAVDPLIVATVARSLPRAVAGVALLEIGPAAVPRLLGIAGQQDPAIRAAAVELVGLLGGATDAEPLRPRLRDASPDVRAAAAAALGRLGAGIARDELIEALGDRVPFVRAAAARALGVIGGRSAASALLEVAKHDQFDPASEAARALARIDPLLVLASAEAPDAGPHLCEAADRLAL